MSGADHVKAPPRMLTCLVLSVLIAALALYVQSEWPGSPLAVTAYKAHLMALGGWGGYWLDRELFPYDRPHTYLLDEEVADEEPTQGQLIIAPGSGLGWASMRRAIIVAACLICVGLGA